MAREDLEIQDKLGYTALYYTIIYYPERVEVAEGMVNKNHNLLTILPPRDGAPLVVVAQETTKAERMAAWIYILTPPETLKVSDTA
ncbi:hypothetical protein D8674_006486 [Pyrus ussuriensis x Pyrus communis]|uniref:Uncharacterized protein n=1 Tax=Pyrus ussuriensis x Pyrus communis TaxID=2448454 RepID=A0A5N5FUJ2_9ROSA|nr:hypothetical protein D8674_006486 [Pyrus ussuriensis x Pyrus communis]